MPVIKSAKKKLRQDIKRTRQNAKVRKDYKSAIKDAKKNPSTDAVAKMYSSLDQAVKKNVIHKNKAARLKSQIVASPNGKS